jgi:hypothetical protein
MAMTKERKGEIAMDLLMDQKMQEGIKFAGMKRELGNIASRTGIPVEELKEFVRDGIIAITEKALS